MVNFSAFLFYLPDLRRKERKLLEESGFLQSLTMATFFMACTVAMTLMFLIHTCLQLKLTAPVVSVWGALVPRIDRELSHVSFPTTCPSKI